MKVKYKVESDDLCPNCAAKIEEAVKKIDGVNDANLSFLTLKLKMELADDANEDTIFDEANRLADKLEPGTVLVLSLIHISETTRLRRI